LPPHPRPSPRRAPALPWCASPLSWLPGGGRSRARPRRRLLRRLRGSRRRGRGLPPLRASPAPIASFLLLFLAGRRVLLGPRRGEPLLLAQPELLAPLLPVLPSPDAPLLLAGRPLLLPPLRCARARDRGMGGSDRAAFTALICKTEEADEASKHANIPRTGRTRKDGTPLTSGPTGSMVNAQRIASLLRAALRSMARRARVAAYSCGKRSGSRRDCASATGSASSCISKMRSGLSIRGTIRR
jgi:hypothetical protein